ncbi:hypothetical protein [Cyclobacterium amurskyense]|uniref:Uncharacterized protein n=1 Tax=Cyclobacterium amurskyense TaxID=320787 RepID=A0A0H4PBP3_9BACT|nr:hypothetical protein [Cyclobacterium amurskyense]AKP51669.1 hypothetical protein CA2015_2249 [Cyclobacterium amurskyense]|tara:strand:+ start:2872 stop:3060 length:189 start_codon:yes stop_codon:yes gene_type:complete
MKLLLKIISFVGLGLSIIPAILVFGGQMESSTCKQLMFIGTILWFVTAPSWMIKKEAVIEEE